MKDIQFTVEYIKPLNDTVFEIKLKSEERLPSMRCGQFLQLETGDPSLILRRPFCLYKFDDYSVTLIIAIVGKGTKNISNFKTGDKVMAILPLGNGFTLEKYHKKIALVGGGVGCAPLLAAALKYPEKEFRAYLGFANEKNVLFEYDFKQLCQTKVSTDDGSYGYKGYVTQMFEESLGDFAPDVMLTCGSENMLKALAKISLNHNIPGFMTGEAHMACGVGACLVCACRVKQKDGEIRSLRACADGPVFRLEDIIL